MKKLKVKNFTFYFLLFTFIVAGLAACAKAPRKIDILSQVSFEKETKAFVIAEIKLSLYEISDGSRLSDRRGELFYRKILGSWRESIEQIKRHKKPVAISISGPVVGELLSLKNGEIDIGSLISADPWKLSEDQQNYLIEKYNINKDTSSLLNAQIAEAIGYLGFSLKRELGTVLNLQKYVYTIEDKDKIIGFLKEKILEFGTLIEELLDIENIDEATTSKSNASLDLLSSSRIKAQVLESIVDYKKWRGRFPDGFVPHGGYLNEEAIVHLEKTPLNWVVAQTTPTQKYIRTIPQLLYITVEFPKVIITDIENINNIFQNKNIKLIDFTKFMDEVFPSQIRRDTINSVPLKISTSTFKPISLDLNEHLIKIKNFLSGMNEIVDRYRNSGRASIGILMNIQDKFLLAESAYVSLNYENEKYDKIFRRLLIEIYRLINISPPVELFAPIVEKESYIPDEIMGTLININCDGKISPGEWDESYKVEFSSGNMQKIYWGHDSRNVYFMVKLSTGEIETVSVYLGHMNVKAATLIARNAVTEDEIMDFPLYLEVNWQRSVPHKTVIYRTTGGELWEPLTGNYEVGYESGILEFTVPLKYIDARPGKKIFHKISVNWEMFPVRSFFTLTAPLIETPGVIISYIDPLGDNRGPGNYKFPADIIENSGNLDLRSVEINEKYDEKIISIELSSLDNLYSAPMGFSPAIIDIYIDVNNKPGLGRTSLLEGRLAFTSPEDAWEYCISLNGWDKGVYNTHGRKIAVPEVSVSPFSRKINIFVSDKIIPASVKSWGVVVVLMAGDESGKLIEIESEEETVELEQDLDSSPLDSKLLTEQEHLTGFTGRRHPSDTNILDVILPPGYTQKQVLGASRRGGAIELPALRRR